MSIMCGNLFEKVGVNISTVYGLFDQEFRKSIPGTQNSAEFFATGISVVAHMSSPLVPAVHFNTRFIATEKNWFGGCADLTPIYPDDQESIVFHDAFKKTCNKYDKNYYPKFKKACDDYFYLHHRQEPRGIGGIFFDYFNNNDFDSDFNFVKDVGTTFKNTYTKIVKNKNHKSQTRSIYIQNILFFY